jgi:ABC-type multidrug transport system permease subunit
MIERRRDNPLWELTKSRLREFYREPGAVFWVFGFPILLAVGLGIAFRNAPPPVPIVGVERCAAAAWVVAALETADGVDLEQLDPASLARALRTGRVDIAVAARPDGGLDYRFDPMRAEARIARYAVDDVLQAARGRLDVVEVHEETVEETGARYIDFLLPGLIGLNLMGSSMWGVGYTIVLNRKRRLLKRLAATPMRRSHYMLSYFLSRLIFLCFEVAALLTFGALVFDVTVHGSLAGVALLSLFGAACFTGIALLIAARVQSIEAAAGWMNAVQLPMWLLSGAFFSYERFPAWLHPILQLLPLTALNDGLRAVMNDGLALGDTLPQTGVMAAWAGLTFWVALRTFRWQ